MASEMLERMYRAACIATGRDPNATRITVSCYGGSSIPETKSMSEWESCLPFIRSIAEAGDYALGITSSFVGDV